MASPLELALSALGKTFKGYGRAVSAAPVTTLGTTAILAPSVANYAKDMGTDFTGRAMKEMGQQRELDFLQMMKARKLRQVMGDNTARLAALDPHTYNEVLAGRRLPQGAEVFGGAPRGDLLEQLAMGMATGKYRPEPTDDELMNLL